MEPSRCARSLWAVAVMDYRCPNAAYLSLHLHVHRVTGGFSLEVVHSHRGLPPGTCEKEFYGPLSHAELVDVVVATLELAHPGAHPWGQLDFSIED